MKWHIQSAERKRLQAKISISRKTKIQKWGNKDHSIFSLKKMRDFVASRISLQEILKGTHQDERTIECHVNWQEDGKNTSKHVYLLQKRVLGEESTVSLWPFALVALLLVRRPGRERVWESNQENVSGWPSEGHIYPVQGFTLDPAPTSFKNYMFSVSPF